MSQHDKLKLTVQAAAHEIERILSPIYPQRFANIDAAKGHIKKLAHEAKYDYTLPRNYNLRPIDPHPIVRLVKDKVCFIVAIRAHEQGEFYLNEPLPDRESLRKAVESDIARTQPLIRTWPSSFCNGDVAAKYVTGACALQNFSYTRFAGVAEDKFRGYVAWNTARRAWEQGRFELGLVPKEWKREEKTVKPATLNNAIEADIARLIPLVRSWPATFMDLNEARNFVQNWSYNNKFRYTGWHDVEPRKFGLYVHFNTAKYALEKGLFRVERAVPKRSVMTRPLSQVGEGYQKQKGLAKEQEDEIKVIEVIEVHAPATQTTEQRGVCDTVTRAEDNKTVNSGSSHSDEESDQNSSSSSPKTSDSEDNALVQAIAELAIRTTTEPEEQAITEPEEQTSAAVDPFKDLVTELQRGYILKAAFD